jgi:hypothetical protein
MPLGPLEVLRPDRFATPDRPNTATLPSPWVRADVGAVGIAGKSSYANGVYTLEGAGTDVYSTADAFHFVYRTWSGDGDLVVRVASLTAPSGSP